MEQGKVQRAARLSLPIKLRRLRLAQVPNLDQFHQVVVAGLPIHSMCRRVGEQNHQLRMNHHHKVVRMRVVEFTSRLRVVRDKIAQLLPASLPRRNQVCRSRHPAQLLLHSAHR